MDSTTYDEFGELNPGIPGGVKSTAQDYLRFLRMVINQGMYGSKRILSTASIQEMFTDQNTDNPLYQGASSVWPVSHPDYSYGMDTVQYGYGSWIFGQKPTSGFVEEISSPGLYGTFPWVDRNQSTNRTFTFWSRSPLAASPISPFTRNSTR